MSQVRDPRKRYLQAHFRFSKVPFSKYAHASGMFDSKGQKALLDALVMWTDLRGIALVTGPPGVGKSITLRRFILCLDKTASSQSPSDTSRPRPTDFYVPSTAASDCRRANSRPTCSTAFRTTS